MQSYPSAAAPSAANDLVRPSLSRATLLLFAIASGLAVANVYFAHPLLDVMSDDMGLKRSTAGLIIASSQVGYAIGLIFLVPLGDLFDRRKLILAHFLLSVLSLLAIGFCRKCYHVVACNGRDGSSGSRHTGACCLCGEPCRSDAARSCGGDCHKRHRTWHIAGTRHSWRAHRYWRMAQRLLQFRSTHIADFASSMAQPAHDRIARRPASPTPHLFCHL